MIKERESSWGYGSIARVKRKTPNRLTAATLTWLFGSTVFLSAGDIAPTVSTSEATEQKSFWEKYKTLGKIYSNPDNPYIQSFSLVNRVHLSYGSVDGESGSGQDIDFDTTEVRRLRPGFKAKVFKFVDLKAQAEIFDDGRPRGRDDRGFTFRHTWDLYARLDAKKAFELQNVDSLKIGYGRRETHTSYEWDTSSNKLKTVERSGISNKIWPSTDEFSNPTGAWIDVKKDNIRTEFGVFSTAADDILADWNAGTMYWGNLWWDLSDRTGAKTSQLYLAGFYQDVDSGDEDLAGGVEWAGSLSYSYGTDKWNVAVEGIVGDNGEQSNPAREGSFYGFVFLPSTWIIKDKLEGVFRYQYAASEEAQGIRLNSRYVRRAGTTLNENDSVLRNGRGDEHHSAYLGVKYHFYKNHAHALLGVEYDDITSNGQDVFNGWTTWLGFRTYF